MTPTLQESRTDLALAPEDDLQPTPSPDDFGPNNENLPDCLKDAILRAIKDAQTQERYVRRREIIQDAEIRFYDMGIQHIVRDSNNGWAQVAPGQSYSFEGNNFSFGEYIDDYNIFTEFALIQRAKLSENTPGIDFEPIDPNDPDDIEAAAAAEGMRREFERNNDMREIEQSIYYHLQMGGRAVVWTYSEKTPEKFGGQRNGQSKPRVCAKVYGTIEAKVPIFANSREDFWYTLLMDDPDIRTARTEYPEIADKIEGGQSCLEENAYERILRLGLIQGSQGGRYGLRIGDSIQHLITRVYAFLRLSAFEKEKETYIAPDGQMEMITDDEDESGQSQKPKTIKEKLAEIFPDGVRATVVGSQYAQAENKSIDDCITVGNAYIGKGQSRMPVMRPMVVVQDRFNSTMNYIAECFDYGAPSIWVNCDPVEFAAFKKQHASPYALRNMKQLPQGQKLTDSIYREEQPEVGESQQKYLEFINGALPQFILSVPPSIWGQAMADQKTALGYQLASAQAMGILGVFYAVGQRMTADIFYQNCLAIMDDPDYPEQISIPGQGGKATVIHKASLSKGNFRAFPDTDSGFPESTQQKRATLERIVTQLAATPLAAQILGSPRNVSLMVRESGVPEIFIPEAQSCEKQQREIETLLSEAPVLAQPIAAMLAAGAGVPQLLQAINAARQQGAAMQQAAMVAHAAVSIAAQASGQGAPPPPAPFDPASIAKSSVAIWPTDYHLWEAKECRDWLSSDERNTEETIGRPDPELEGETPVPNIAGILNVVLHWMEHTAAEALEAPPVSGPLPAPNVKPAQPALAAAPAAVAPGAVQ